MATDDGTPNAGGRRTAPSVRRRFAWLRPGRGRRRRVLAWTCLVGALVAAAATWWTSRYDLRFGRIVGPMSVSLSAGQGEVHLWWTGRTDVFGSYDVGWAVGRSTPRPEDGWMGRLLGGRWMWVLPPGGNEVIPPHAHRVWAIPGFVEYECDDGIWADGGAARSLSVLLWPWGLVLGLPIVPLWIAAGRARRRADGCCLACGHRLAEGQERCPECAGPVRAT